MADPQTTMIPCSLVPAYPHAYWAPDQHCAPHPALLLLCSSLLCTLLCAAPARSSVPVEAERQRRIIRQHNTETSHTFTPTVKQCFLDNIKQHNCCSLSRTFFFATKQRSKAFEQLSSSSVAAPRAILRQDSFATSIIYLCPKLFLKIFLV